MSGFYLMHRGWRDNPVFKDEPCSEREAWLWMIEEAAYQDRRKRVGSTIVTVRRGQIATSTRFVADAWGWTHSKARRFLERLENEGMIGTATDTGVTVITLCNYERFQAPDQGADTLIGIAPAQERHSTGTNEKERKQRKELIGEGEDARADVGDVVGPTDPDPRPTPTVKPIRVTGPSPEAKAIVATFDAARTDAYGLDQRRFSAHHTDHVLAQRWHTAGADLEFCRLVLTRACHDWKAEGRAPPDTLKALDKRMQNAIADAKAAATKPIPEGTANVRQAQQRDPVRGVRPASGGRFAEILQRDLAGRA